MDKNTLLQVWPIPAFDDNYIWCIHDGHSALVVDPGDSAPVLDYLAKQQLKLKGIVITHHHTDHTGESSTYYKLSTPIFQSMDQRARIFQVELK